VQIGVIDAGSGKHLRIMQTNQPIAWNTPDMRADPSVHAVGTGGVVTHGQAAVSTLAPAGTADDRIGATIASVAGTGFG
jgi:hypothetical protein